MGPGLRSLKADRGDLLLHGKKVALEGTFDVTLADGTGVRVRPVCDLLQEHVKSCYTPELQEQITWVHPDTVRMMARKVASKRTNIMHGMNACKIYHGDLIERAMCLVLGVSGNWGRKGTGIRCWAAGLLDGSMLAMGKNKPGVQAAAQVLESREKMIADLKQLDPTLTTELAMTELTKGPRGILGQVMENKGANTPAAAQSIPAFWWYYQSEMGGRWNNPAWGDSSMSRTFDEYLQEAIDKGWWDGLNHPGRDEVPQVLIECGGNTLRRTRGGKKAVMNTLWPKLETIIDIDFRMTQTASYADYFLPAAQHYEKVSFAITCPQVMNLTLGDKVIEPLGEAREEWRIFTDLLAVIGERATARGLEEYMDPEGRVRCYQDLVDQFTMNGYYKNQEVVADEQIRDSVVAGTLPQGTTLEKLRETGVIRFIDWGIMPGALSQASPFFTNETHTPFRNHVEKGDPFPSYSRRAQFYIDHEWFLEAGE